MSEFIHHSGTDHHETQAVKANHDEWYDQGFDLSDESDNADSAFSQSYSINMDLVKSASEQFSSTDRDPKRLAHSDVKLQVPHERTPQKTGPRQEAIYVGGAGKIVAPLEREYSFNNAPRKNQGYTPEGMNFDAENVDSEYGIGSPNKRTNNGLSSADLRFLNAMRNEEDEENRAKSAYNEQQATSIASKQFDIEHNTKASLEAAHSSYRLASMPTNAAPNKVSNYRLATMPKNGKPEAASNYRFASMTEQPHDQATQKEYRTFDPDNKSKYLSGSGQTGVTGMSESVSYNNFQAQATASVASALESNGSGRPKDPTDTNTNRNKSLEELAKEYPELGPEDLVKLRRSSNRCHLVTRIPVFDAKSNIGIYELKFTSGRVFQINSLKSQHVYHVLFGYFIRRGISCFIGRGKLAMVMMPITYDLINYIDRFSINRLILRICPEQPVTPSALHLLTSLKRSGMHFAIDMMLLLKKDWNKAILSLEYVMIDLSARVKEQLGVFQRLKLKAPWLKSIGYNDVNHEGYALLASNMIDFLDAPFWSPQLNFNQDVSVFAPAQEQALVMINEMFSENPNYQIFLQFLSRNETVSRNLAVFLYRFRHVSPRQIQNIQDLYQCLIENSASRSFSVVISYSLLQLYCKSASISSQSVLQEYYAQALIRGYFAEYMAKVFEDQYLERFAFQAGMFSLLHLFVLREEVEVLIDEQYESIVNHIYGENELLSDIIDCAKALESTDLLSVFKFIQKYQLPPASVLVSYEKGIMRTNELLLVLNLVPYRT